MMKHILIFILLLVNSFCVLGQTYSISGNVKDEDGKPLIGVNVILTGTGRGAATDVNGKYKINNLNPGIYTLEFSMIGYNSVTIPDKKIADSSIMVDVRMTPGVIQSNQEVVVTAEKYEQKISELPVSASVIPSKEFSEKYFTSLSEALRYAPGVQMVGDQVSIRGSSGYSRGAGTRVLVEIDGFPIYSGDTGEITWEMIPVTEIDRVEIIKGPASSLYGSTALGGVINIITKKISNESRTYIKAGVGVYDKPYYSQWDWSPETRTYNTLTLAHTQRFGNFGFSAALTKLNDMSYEKGAYSSRYIGYLKTVYNFSPTSSLSFFANSLNEIQGDWVYWKDLQDALIPVNDYGQNVTSERYMLGMKYNNVVSENFSYDLKGSFYKIFWHDNTRARNASYADVYRLEGQSNILLTNKIVLVTGFDAYGALVNSNVFGKPSGGGLGVYLQADYKVDSSLTLTAGSRVDFAKLDTLKPVAAATPKLGLNYKLTKNLILRSSFGTGFRAPSLAEVFTSAAFTAGITFKPNPKLKPEKNISFEVGANYQPFSGLSLDGALFRTEYYDFIQWAIDTDGEAFFANVQRARIEGVEVNLNSGMFDDHLSFKLNYTYLWARDIQQNIALKYRPRNQLTADVSLNLAGFELGSDFRYWSKVEQMDFELVDLGIIPDGRVRVPVYVVDFRVGYNFSDLGFPARIFFNVNNAFNYNYVELIANIAPIRNFSLSTELAF
jgi:outer membrane receptor for ferrienterochelin and colicins